MPSKTLARAAAPHRRRHGAVGGIAVALGVALALPVSSRLDSPSRADLAFRNDTGWDVGVDVLVDGGARLPLAVVDAGTTRVVEEIARAGRTWRLRWTFSGREIARTEVPAIDDARAAIAVPAAVTTALREGGVPPSP